MFLPSSQLIKQANRLSAVLRAGKLGVKSMGRILDDAVQQGVPNANQWRPYIQPDGSLQSAYVDDFIKTLRKGNNMTRELQGNWLPAHIAYSAPDRSALLRTTNLMGPIKVDNPILMRKFEGAPTGIPSANWIKSESPNFRLQKLKLTNQKSFNDPSKIPANVSEQYKFVDPSRPYWGVVDSWEPRYAYHPNTNKILGAGFGHPMTRHEIGHFGQVGLAYNNPTALNIRTMKTFRDIHKASPATATKALYNTIHGIELQGHALASRAGRGGAKLRAATSPTGSYPLPQSDQGYETLMQIAKNPAMIKNPSALSTIEHLYRNYNVPIGPI